MLPIIIQNNNNLCSLKMYNNQFKDLCARFKITGGYGDPKVSFQGFK